MKSVVALILAFQVRSGGDVEDVCVSLEVSNPVQDGGAGGNPTFESSVDDVGDEAKAGSAIGSQILFGGDVAGEHDVVAGGLGSALGHPKPEGRLP